MLAVRKNFQVNSQDKSIFLNAYRRFSAFGSDCANRFLFFNVELLLVFFEFGSRISAISRIYIDIRLTL